VRGRGAGHEAAPNSGTQTKVAVPRAGPRGRRGRGSAVLWARGPDRTGPTGPAKALWAPHPPGAFGDPVTFVKRAWRFCSFRAVRCRRLGFTRAALARWTPPANTACCTGLPAGPAGDRPRQVPALAGRPPHLLSTDSRPGCAGSEGAGRHADRRVARLALSSRPCSEPCFMFAVNISKCLPLFSAFSW
jgi:hypothetical protein